MVSSQAAPLATACSSITTLQSIKNSGGCQVGDKQFTGFENLGSLNAIPNDWIVAIDAVGQIYNVNIGQPSAGGTVLLPAGSPWGIQYLVTVDTTMSFFDYITRVSVSLNPGGFGAGTAYKVVKDLNGNVLNSATATAPGGPNPNTFFITPSQAIRVEETITLTTGVLSSFTDAYEQTAIPEPGTYAMMGLGLAALGLIARRKKA